MKSEWHFVETTESTRSIMPRGRKAVINIKLVQEGGKIIFSVKNPVAEKVQVMDGIVLDSNGGMHGVGLMNVKAVVDKYGGDFIRQAEHTEAGVKNNNMTVAGSYRNQYLA